MKVTISEVSSTRDAVMAAGLTLWIENMGVTVETAPMSPVPRPAGPEQTQIRRKGAELGEGKKIAPKAPVKRAYKKRAAEAKLVPAGAAEKPHVTIRQHVLGCLTEKPKSLSEVRSELLSKGVISGLVDVGQHLYLAKRDGLVTLEGDGRYKAA